MTEQENYKLQYKLMGINARMEYITLKLYDEDLSETMKEKYMKEFNKLKLLYDTSNKQLLDEYIKKMKLK